MGYDTLPESIERNMHFIFQEGSEGYLNERAGLALYLIKNSTTPDIFNSPDEFSVPGRMRAIGNLTFPVAGVGDFYRLLAGFNPGKPGRGYIYEDVKNFLEIHQYYFEHADGKLTVRNVDGLVSMLANCL